MAEKKSTKKATATAKVAAPKKAATKVAIVLNAENAGFKAGDVYQTLAAAEKALTVSEISKAAGITEEEVVLGAGWLFKEGKILTAEDNKIVLA